MDTQKQLPRHLEARNLGANISDLRKEFAKCRMKNVGAGAIRKAWDYRQAGLTIDGARAKITDWLAPTRRYFPPAARGPGYYLSLQSNLTALRREVKGAAEAINTIPLAHSESKPGWQQARVRIMVGDRVIVTQYHEDVTWSSSNSWRRWPESTRRTYTSHLLRADFTRPPTAREYLDGKITYHQDTLPYFTEKCLSHDLRGHWWSRVITELLGPDQAGKFSYLPPERPPVTVYKIVEQNGQLRSVYAPEMVYPLGQWVTDEVHPDHNGGIYCYLSQSEAVEAAKKNEIFHEKWSAAKTLVLCEAQARGRCIVYASGKYAFSHLQILRVLQVI